MDAGPVLGADEPVAVSRASHAVLGAKPWPEIGSVEHIVLDGPHGSLYVRVHTPKHLSCTPSGALIYMHGGGWTVRLGAGFEQCQGHARTAGKHPFCVHISSCYLLQLV